MEETTSSFGPAAHAIAEAARLLNDPRLVDDAEALRRAARDELAERRKGLEDAAHLAGVEADVRDQLAALNLLQGAREHFWEAEALRARADAIQRKRERRASLAHARQEGEQIARQLDDLPEDPALAAHRRSLMTFHELNVFMADDRAEDAFQTIDGHVIRAKRAFQSGARDTARRLRRRRMRLWAGHYARRLVRFAISFGVFAYGVDQLTSGARGRGVISVLVALVVWLLTGRLETWTKQRQDKAYRRWLSGFLDRVARDRWSTDLALLVEERLRQLETEEDRALDLAPPLPTCSRT
jgi:hypothetical protein